SNMAAMATDILGAVKTAVIFFVVFNIVSPPFSPDLISSLSHYIPLCLPFTLPTLGFPQNRNWFNYRISLYYLAVKTLRSKKP
ncbi:MAG: hypothetical protein KKG34_03335, partial [Proteobacteria bacterium]|nr:hypothetical protein [Pseudomonadota bacterium]